jgi:hexosaminidase
LLTLLYIYCLRFLQQAMFSECTAGRSDKQGISLIPYPKEVKLSGNNFNLGKDINIVLDKNATGKDRFAANELIKIPDLSDWHQGKISRSSSKGSIVLSRKSGDKNSGNEGYSLISNQNGLTIHASAEPGLFYGVQTQCN